MSQLEFFRKNAGISRAEENYKEELRFAQRIAFQLAREKGRVTVEDVREAMFQARNGHFKSGNWMGAIFRGKKWERIGFVNATHEGSNSRLVSVWRLRGSVYG